MMKKIIAIRKTEKSLSDSIRKLFYKPIFSEDFNLISNTSQGVLPIKDGPAHGINREIYSPLMQAFSRIIQDKQDIGSINAENLKYILNVFKSCRQYKVSEETIRYMLFLFLYILLNRNNTVKLIPLIERFKRVSQVIDRTIHIEDESPEMKILLKERNEINKLLTKHGVIHFEKETKLVIQDLLTSRYSTSHIVMIAYILGVNNLQVVFDNELDEDRIEDALETAKLLGINLSVSLEFSAGLQKERTHYQFIFPFKTADEFQQFKNKPESTHFFNQINRKQSTKLDNLEMMINNFNKVHLPIINMEYEAHEELLLKPLKMDDLRSVTESPYSKRHLALLIKKNLETLYIKRMEYLIRILGKNLNLKDNSFKLKNLTIIPVLRKYLYMRASLEFQKNQLDEYYVDQRYLTTIDYPSEISNLEKYIEWVSTQGIKVICKGFQSLSPGRLLESILTQFPHVQNFNYYYFTNNSFNVQNMRSMQLIAKVLNQKKDEIESHLKQFGYPNDTITRIMQNVSSKSSLSEVLSENNVSEKDIESIIYRINVNQDVRVEKLKSLFAEFKIPEEKGDYFIEIIEKSFTYSLEIEINSLYTDDLSVFGLDFVSLYKYQGNINQTDLNSIINQSDLSINRIQYRSYPNYIIFRSMIALVKDSLSQLWEFTKLLPHSNSYWNNSMKLIFMNPPLFLLPEYLALSIIGAFTWVGITFVRNVASAQWNNGAGLDLSRWKMRNVDWNDVFNSLFFTSWSILFQNYIYNQVHVEIQKRSFEDVTFLNTVVPYADLVSIAAINIFDGLYQFSHNNLRQKGLKIASFNLLRGAIAFIGTASLYPYISKLTSNNIALALTIGNVVIFNKLLGNLYATIVNYMFNFNRFYGIRIQDYRQTIKQLLYEGVVENFSFTTILKDTPLKSVDIIDELKNRGLLGQTHVNESNVLAPKVNETGLVLDWAKMLTVRTLLNIFKKEDFEKPGLIKALNDTQILNPDGTYDFDKYKLQLLASDIGIDLDMDLKRQVWTELVKLQAFIKDTSFYQMFVKKEEQILKEIKEYQNRKSSNRSPQNILFSNLIYIIENQPNGREAFRHYMIKTAQEYNHSWQVSEQLSLLTYMQQLLNDRNLTSWMEDPSLNSKYKKIQLKIEKNRYSIGGFFEKIRQELLSIQQEKMRTE